MSTYRQNILMKNYSNWTKRLNFDMFGLLQTQCKEDNEDSTGQCSAQDSRYSEVRQGKDVCTLTGIFGETLCMTQTVKVPP